MNELPPLNDPKMWRKLMARCHPDAEGEHELFVWASALRDAVDGAVKQAEIAQKARQQPVRVHYSSTPATASTIWYRAS